MGDSPLSRFHVWAQESTERSNQMVSLMRSRGTSISSGSNYGSSSSSSSSSSSIWSDPTVKAAMITGGLSLLSTALPSVLNAFKGNKTETEPNTKTPNTPNTPNTTDPNKTADPNKTGGGVINTNINTSNLVKLTNKVTTKGNGFCSNRKDKLQEEITRVGSELSTLQKQRDEMESSIKNAKDRNDKNKLKLAGAKQAATQAQKNVDAHTDLITAEKGKITAQQKIISDSKGTITTLESKKTTLNSEIVSLKTQIESATLQMDDIKIYQADGTTIDKGATATAKATFKQTNIVPLENSKKEKEAEMKENEKKIENETDVVQKNAQAAIDASNKQIEFFEQKKADYVKNNEDAQSELTTIEQEMKEDDEVTLNKAPEFNALQTKITEYEKQLAAAEKALGTSKVSNNKKETEGSINEKIKSNNSSYYGSDEYNLTKG